MAIEINKAGEGGEEGPQKKIRRDVKTDIYHKKGKGAKFIQCPILLESDYIRVIGKYKQPKPIKRCIDSFQRNAKI